MTQNSSNVECLESLLCVNFPLLSLSGFFFAIRENQTGGHDFVLELAEILQKIPERAERSVPNSRGGGMRGRGVWNFIWRE